MEIEASWVVGVVALTVLTVLLTGPGLWSEKWGWDLFHRIFSRRGGTKGPPPPRA